MSRRSDAKKARRKKRQVTRDSTWMPESDFDRAISDEDRLETIDAALADLDDWLTPRGWVMDGGDDGLVSWHFPPSAADLADPDREQVTRVWITIAQNPDDVVLEFGALLVGFGPGDEPYVLDPDNLADDIGALEAYRPGLARPVFA